MIIVKYLGMCFKIVHFHSDELKLGPRQSCARTTMLCSTRILEILELRCSTRANSWFDHRSPMFNEGLEKWPSTLGILVEHLWTSHRGFLQGIPCYSLSKGPMQCSMRILNILELRCSTRANPRFDHRSPMFNEGLEKWPSTLGILVEHRIVVSTRVSQQLSRA